MHDNLLSGLEIKLSTWFLCCNATVNEKIPFHLVQTLWFSFYPLEQFKGKKKLSFSWLVVKKLNKNCSTKEHCLTLISCFLQCWCLVSVSLFQPHFKLWRLFVLCNAVGESRIINHIVYTRKKCFSPDARDISGWKYSCESHCNLNFWAEFM